MLPLLIELDYFSIARCISFFPFFLIGWWVRENKLVEKLEKIIASSSQRVILQTSLFFISIICCYIATKIPAGFYWGLHPVEYPFLLVIGCKVATWIIAVVNSLAVYIFMPKNKEISEGQNTLFYYLYHTILLYPVFDIINDYLPNTILMSVVVLVGVMVTLYSMARIPLLKKILVVGKKH